MCLGAFYCGLPDRFAVCFDYNSSILLPWVLQDISFIEVLLGAAIALYSWCICLCWQSPYCEMWTYMLANLISFLHR